MCIKDDGTSMQWQIQLGSVEVAPTQLICKGQTTPIMNLLTLKCFGVLHMLIYALFQILLLQVFDMRFLNLKNHVIDQLIN